MNKTELIAKVAEAAEISPVVAGKALAATLDAIKAELVAGEKVTLIGFGTFEVRERAARQGHNPQTGAAIKIKASKAPAFKPGKTLKDAVNAPKKKASKKSAKK